MKVMHIVGADMTDAYFETDPAIIGDTLRWNITRIARDAEAGKFGGVEEAWLDSLAPMTPAHYANVDWPKITAMMDAHRNGDPILTKPVLVVETMIGLVRHRIIVDGNQRITARQQLGMRSFLRYIVPPELERGYRIEFVESEL